MSEPDEDIRNLFSKIGQQVSYQEIRHQSQTEEARGRWPLLHSLQVPTDAGVTPPPPAPELKPLFPGSSAPAMPKLPGFLHRAAAVEEAQPREEKPALGGLFGKPREPEGSGLFNRAPEPARSLFGKPASEPSGGIFGKSAPEPSGGIFGKSAPEPSSGIFGKHAPEPSSGIFGKHAPEPSSGIFGKHAPEPSSGIFGKLSQPEESRGGLFGKFLRRPAQQPALTEMEAIFNKLAKS